MKVNLALFGDFLVDAAPKVTSLLETGLPVTIYNGDKDYICNWEGSDFWTSNLNWSGSEGFKKSKWEKLGYGESREFKNFKFVRVYNSGHMVPMD